MAGKTPQNPIYRAYIRARAAVFDKEQRTLTPYEFLQQVDPGRKRKPESAARYMRKLASGERSGSVIKRRADSGAGKMYNVTFVNDSGDIVDSANIEIPLGVSLLDLYEDDAIIRAADSYMQARQNRARRQNLANIAAEDAQGSAGADSTEGLKLYSLREIKSTRYPVAFLKPKTKTKPKSTKSASKSTRNRR